MDILELDKLMEAAKVADKISAGIVDDAAYNVLTKATNEEVLMESREEIDSILRNGKSIRGDVDVILEELDKDVAALDALSESVNTPVEKPVTKQVAATGQKVDDAVSFQEAKPVPQKEFVKTAEKAKNAGGFEDGKNAKMDTQNEADLIDTKEKDNGKLMESIDSFTDMIRSQKDANNEKLVECVLQAFSIVKKAIK